MATTFTSSPNRPGVPCTRCGGHGYVVHGPCFLCMGPRVRTRTAAQLATIAQQDAHFHAMNQLRRTEAKAAGLTNDERRIALATVAALATVGAVAR